MSLVQVKQHQSKQVQPHQSSIDTCLLGTLDGSAAAAAAKC